MQAFQKLSMKPDNVDCLVQIHAQETSQESRMEPGVINKEGTCCELETFLCTFVGPKK